MATAALRIWSGPSARALEAEPPLSELTVDSWEGRQGGPSGTIRAITQTREGYLWLGTESEGLWRFDGVQFERVMALEPVLGRGVVRVNDLLVARDGALWVATPVGIAVLREGRWLPDGSLPKGRTADLVHEGRDGTTWFAENSLSLYASTGGIVRRRALEEFCRSLASDGAGGLWAGCDDCLLYVHGDQVRRYTARDGLGSDFVSSVVVDRAGSVWAATRAGLARLQGGRVVERRTTRDGLSSDNLSLVYLDRDDSLWVATTTGVLNRVRGEGIEALQLSDPSRRASISAMFEDREGSLWIGTTSGLKRVKGGGIASVASQEGLPHTLVAAVAADASGTVWIATDGGGVCEWRGGCRRVWNRKKGLLSDFMGTLHVGGDGALWVGHPGGLSRIKDGAVRSWALGGAYYSAIADSPGGVAVTPKGRGLLRFADGQLEPYQLADGSRLTDERLRFVYAMMNASDGNLWIASTEGAFRVRDGVLHPLRGGPSTARALLESADGTVWVASPQGLGRVAGDEVALATTRHGLAQDDVIGVAEDALGFLWLASSNEISRLRRSDLEHALRGGPPARVETFGVADGLRNPDLRGQPAVCAARDGRLWFATANGAVVIDPRHLRKNPLPPPVVIDAVAADGTPLPIAEAIRLPAGTRRIELRFAGLSLLAPERVRFRHKLDGFDLHWVEAGGRRYAAYTNVPPGRYRFRVRACNDAGVWNEEGAAISLTLPPRFHQTIWFPALLGLVLAAAGAGAVRYRIGQVHRRFAAVLAERVRLARELHDTLGQGLAGIGLQIDAAAAQLGRPATAGQCLEEARRMLDYSHEETRRTLLELRSEALEREDLAAALGELAAELSRGTAVRIEVAVTGPPRRLGQATEHHLFRIAQEALTNALKHSAGAAVSVSLEFAAGSVVLRIRDDGRGLPDAEPGSTAFGIRGMRERARKMGAEIEIVPAVGGGLEVRVCCPLGRPKARSGLSVWWKRR